MHLNMAASAGGPVARQRPQAGVSLIELMIAITIALIILAAMSWIFVGNSQARAETERANQQIENGSYAMQTLTYDLQMAGYWGDYDIGLAISSSAISVPTALPDPCAADLATLISAMPLPVTGYYQASGLSCISDVRANTDVLVVRRASGCVAGTSNCASLPANGATTGKPYLQVSLCNNINELNSGSPSDQIRLEIDGSKLDRHKKDCTTLAERREVMTHIYFIANNDESGDGIPTLKRAELNPAAPGGWTIVSIAQGVENMRLEYGIDTNGDRIPDDFAADPVNHLNSVCTTAPCVRNFLNTMAVNVNLLVRNPTQTTGYTDTKTYTLGRSADGSPYLVSAANDNFRRHAYSGAVRLINQSIR